jgi:hypothetical protein
MSSKELLFDSFATDYETIGKLRLRRYRDLLGAELEETEQAQRQMTQAMLSLMTLAKRISDVKEVPFDEVVGKLTSGNIADSPWLAEFSDEAFLLVSSVPNQAAIESQMITLFIQSRAEIEGPDGWQPMEDWDLAASKRLPGKFRQQVLAFIRQEQSGEEPAAASKGKAKASAS